MFVFFRPIAPSKEQALPPSAHTLRPSTSFRGTLMPPPEAKKKKKNYLVQISSSVHISLHVGRPFIASPRFLVNLKGVLSAASSGCDPIYDCCKRPLIRERPTPYVGLFNRAQLLLYSPLICCNPPRSRSSSPLIKSIVCLSGLFFFHII